MKIGITWTHGTWKSTLLEKIDNVNKIPEIAREIVEKENLDLNNMSLKDKWKFQIRLLKEQIIRENKIWNNFVSDRTYIDLLAYTRQLEHINKNTILFVKILENLVKKTNKIYDYIFYIPIEFQLEIDGLRHENLNFQKKIDKEIINIFIEFWIKHITLKGNVEERLKKYNNILNNKIL